MGIEQAPRSQAAVRPKKASIWTNDISAPLSCQLSSCVCRLTWLLLAKQIWWKYVVLTFLQWWMYTTGSEARPTAIRWTRHHAGSLSQQIIKARDRETQRDREREREREGDREREWESLGDEEDGEQVGNIQKDMLSPYDCSRSFHSWVNIDQPNRMFF